MSNRKFALLCVLLMFASALGAAFGGALLVRAFIETYLGL